MIYTLTFSPSLDLHIDTIDLKAGATNRSKSQKLLAGGKGINVSKILWEFGLDSICLGFIAGRTGRLLKEMLEGLPSDFIELQEGSSRINIKRRSQKK